MKQHLRKTIARVRKGQEAILNGKCGNVNLEMGAASINGTPSLSVWASRHNDEHKVVDHAQFYVFDTTPLEKIEDGFAEVSRVISYNV